MIPKQNHITSPLAALLAMLKTEGFDISTSTLIDIQKVIANLGDEELADFSDLKAILSPLICRNKEEQEHYNNIFDKYAAYVRQHINEPVVADEVIIKPSNYKKIIAVCIAAIFLSAIIIYFSFFNNKKEQASLTVETISADNSGYLLTNEAVIFRAVLKDTLSSKKYSVSFKIDDSIFQNTREIKKSFPLEGTSKLTAWLLSGNGDTINTYENPGIQVYCEKPPSASIIDVVAGSNKKFNKNYGVQFTNAAKDSNLYKYKWYINDSLLSESPTLSGNFKSDKGYTVKVVVDTKGIHCSTDSIYAMLNEKPAYELSVIGTQPLSLNAETNWKKIAWAALYALLLPLMLAAVLLFYKRKKKAVQKKDVTPLVEPPKEYTGPYKIEFKEQDEKIYPESEIGVLAEAMRKRHVNDLLVLNVKKTIGATIRSGGFPFLQFAPKTQPTDFLVLIDKENAEGPQVKLFEYIIKKLQDEQVNINSYNFYKEPLLLSNEKLNQRMLPVDKIARLYPNTILIIFSDVNAFFETLSTKLKPWVTEKFKSWDNKIILTPVPVNDWDYKENALVQAGFTVVPADLNAHHVITNEINNLINRQKLQNISIPATYTSRFVNFDDWKQLAGYLNDDPMLIQWVCSLAVYPYSDWKVTVAMGKALEEQSLLKIKLVTYTNLLKLSRIKWMQTGLLSDTLRLEMLQHLDNASEIIARKTMLELLGEVQDSITKTSMVADEFELNKTVNKFLLHTHSPGQQELSDEENEKMKEYVENQWLDQPLEKYLNNADDTLLKSNENNKSISLAAYFKIEDAIENRKRNRERFLRRSIAAAIMLAGLYFMYNFYKNESNYKTPQQYADISFNLLKNDVINSFKNIQVSISADGKTYAAEMLSDTTTIIKNFRIDSARDAVISVSNDSNISFQKSLDINSKQFSISIVAPKAPVPLYIRYNDASSYTAMEQQIQSAFPGYNITALQSSFSDSSRIVYYENNQKARADSVVQIVRDNLGINVTTQFVQEIRTPPAVPILFLNLEKNGCNTIAANALPASLNEIWNGGTSNRLINIMPVKKLIYYSTGENTTYGTYRIEQVCLSGSGVYRVITNAGNNYQLFIIKNVTAASFELSVCQNRYNTIEEANSVNESYCDHFNVMSIYFNNDKNKAFLNQQGTLRADQLDKLKKVVYVRNANMVLFNISASSNSFNSPLPDSNKIKEMIKGKLPGRFAYKGTQFRGTPFDRNYITINSAPLVDANTIQFPAGTDISTRVKKIIQVKLGVEASEVTLSAQLKNDLGADDLDNIELIMAFEKEFNISISDQQFESVSTVGQAVSLIEGIVAGGSKTPVAEILLTRITFDAKGYPDESAQSSLQQVVSYLNNYKNASLRIVLYYTDDYSQKEASSYSNSIQNYLQQLKYNKTQVKIELKNNAAQQQQQNAQVQKSYPDIKYADVYGTGFSSGFLSKPIKNAAKKN